MIFSVTLFVVAVKTFGATEELITMRSREESVPLSVESRAEADISADNVRQTGREGRQFPSSLGQAENDDEKGCSHRRGAV